MTSQDNPPKILPPHAEIDVPRLPCRKSVTNITAQRLSATNVSAQERRTTERAQGVGHVRSGEDEPDLSFHSLLPSFRSLLHVDPPFPDWPAFSCRGFHTCQMDAKVSQVEALNVLHATPRMNDTWYIRSSCDLGHPEKLQDIAIETYISLSLTCPFVHSS